MAKRPSRHLLVRLNDGSEVVKPRSVEPEDFDEIVARGAFIHFEMMDSGHLWIGIDAGGELYHVNVWCEKRTLRVRLEHQGPTFIGRRKAKR